MEAMLAYNALSLGREALQGYAIALSPPKPSKWERHPATCWALLVTTLHSILPGHVLLTLCSHVIAQSYMLIGELIDGNEQWFVELSCSAVVEDKNWASG